MVHPHTKKDTRQALKSGEGSNDSESKMHPKYSTNNDRCDARLLCLSQEPTLYERTPRSYVRKAVQAAASSTGALRGDKWLF